MTRVPNRMWITQPGDSLIHREDRVLSRVDAERRGGDHGETYCDLPLRADRKRTSEIPLTGDHAGEVCPRCRAGRVVEYRRHL